MAAISHLKNIRGQLATAFGLHLVQGYTVLEDVTTPDGTEPDVVVIQALGDGHGAGWDGPQEMTYRGHAIDPSNYHFHAGTFSKGANDPAQGVDSWFPTGITYNGTAYAVAKLPSGVASEGNATELQGIYRCLKLPNYNAAGQQIDRNGNTLPGGANPEDYFYYSANPARVAAWLILFGRGLSASRVDWPAWVAWRDYCEALIDWVDGTTTEVESTLEWRSGGGMTVGSGGSAVKGRDTSGVNAWDSATTTTYACPVNASNHRGIQFTISSPYGFMVGLTRATLMSGDGHSYVPLDVALYFELDGNLKVYASGTYVGTLSGGWAAGQTYRVAAEGTVWKFYRDGVAITHALTLQAPPSGALYGGIACNVQNSGVTAASFNPAAGAGSTQGPRKIPRFEAHIAFTQPTSLQDALDQVCFMACSDWQETPKIRFLTPQPAVLPGAELHAAQRQIVHHFDATDAAVDNIVKRTISAYPMDVRERWNFAEAIFRDLDHRDLVEDFVTDDRPALQDQGAGQTPRVISPGQINLGNMNRSQALRVLKWLMRLRSDRVWFCELDAAADSIHVLPGDVVEVSHTTYGWVKKLFMVIDAADKGEGADERAFVLQEYDPANYYSDADHSRGQRSTAAAKPSPYQPPPAVSNVVPAETLTAQADGTVISGIRVTATFAGFVGKQRARVWIKPTGQSDSAWERAATSLLTPHPANGQDVAEIRGVAKVAYDIKVVTEAENTTQLPFSSHATYSITVTGKQTAPAVPSGIGATMGENGQVIWTVNAPTDPDFSHLKVYDGSNSLLVPRVAGNTWQEPPSAASLTRKFSAVNRSGIESALSAGVTYTLPSPLAPSGCAVARSSNDFNITWTAVEGLDYQVSLTPGTPVLWQGKGGQYRHVGAAASFTGTAQYYVRSVRFGVTSAWVSATTPVAAPAAPDSCTLVYDGLDRVVTWTASASADVVSYTLRNESGGLIAVDVAGLRYRYRQAAGDTTGRVRVYAKNRQGVESISYAENSELVRFQAPRNGTLLSDNSFKKTTADNVYGGGVSTRSLLYGDGEAEFTIDYAAGAATGTIFGLSYGDSNGSWDTINYGIHAQTSFFSGTGASRCRVFEDGTVTATSVVWAQGDRLKVAVEGSSIKYYHVSAAGVSTLLKTTTPAGGIKYPLLLDAVAYSQNQILAPGTFRLKGTLVPTTGVVPRWQNVVKCAPDLNNHLVGQSTGASGYDGGAFSLEGIPLGRDGAVEVTAGETNKSKAIGFSTADPDQARTSIGFGVVFGSDGNLYATVGGTLSAILSAFVADTTVVRVGREGGNMVIRKDGLKIYPTGAAVPLAGELHLDTAFASTGALKNLRLYGAGAPGQTIIVRQTGDQTATGAATPGGYPTEDMAYRALGGIGPTLLARGADVAPPAIHKLESLSVVEVDFTDELPGHSNDAKVMLHVVAPERGADPLADFDSVEKVRVNVYDHFGSLLASRVVPYTGGELTLPSIKHSRKYADPADQAIYEIQFKNTEGWSESRYLKAGVLTAAMPTPLARQFAPMELNASAELATGSAAGISNQSKVTCGWMPALANQGAQVVEVRLAGTTDWVAMSGSLASTVGFASAANAGVLSIGGVYDVRVRKTTDSLTSNYVRVRVFPRFAAAAVTDHLPPASFAASINTSKQPTFAFSQPGVSVTIERRTLSGTGTTFTVASPTATYTDTTAAGGTTYVYRLRYNYTGGFSSDWSQPAAIQIPTHSAADPSNLTATTQQEPAGTFQNSLAWLLNGASGSVLLEWKVVASGQDPAQSSFWSSGVTTVTLPASTVSYNHTGRTGGVTYAYRVKAGTSGYSNVVKVTPTSKVKVDAYETRTYQY